MFNQILLLPNEVKILHTVPVKAFLIWSMDVDLSQLVWDYYTLIVLLYK